ncbi:MAG: DUF4221 family protein [Saprospiraceae bacterium]|nr:DUF4221 family protein [Lewinella sp.]MCB0652184.1 DUF4221 family protein [Saprospiraceae bacterium]
MTVCLSLSSLIVFSSCTDGANGDNKGTKNSEDANFGNQDRIKTSRQGSFEDLKAKGGFINKMNPIHIQLANREIGQYKVQHVAFSNGKPILAGYNKNQNSIELVDLENEKIYNSITFPVEGPEGIRKINGIFYHNKDSIFVFGDFVFFLTDENGNRKFTYTINKPGSELKGDCFPDFTLMPTPEAPAYYYPQKKLLAVHVYYSRADQWAIPAYYQQPICAQILLDQKKIELLPMFYPDSFKEANFTPLNGVHFSFNKELVLFGFGSSPDLYTYNLEDNRTFSYQINSAFYKKPSPYSGATDDDYDMIRYISQYTVYENLLFHPQKKLYYLFSINTALENGNTLLFNISVLDINLNLLGESHLQAGSNMIPKYSFIVPEGIAFYDWLAGKESQAVYEVFDFDFKR